MRVTLTNSNLMEWLYSGFIRKLFFIINEIEIVTCKGIIMRIRKTSEEDFEDNYPRYAYEKTGELFG